MSVHETLLQAVMAKLQTDVAPLGVRIETAGTPKHIDYVASIVPVVFVTLESVSYDKEIPIGTRRQRGRASITLTVIGNIASECAAGQPSVFAVLKACSDSLRGQYILPGYSGSFLVLESEQFDDVLPFALSYTQKYTVDIGGEF